MVKYLLVLKTIQLIFLLCSGKLKGAVVDCQSASKQAGMNMLEEGLILSYSIICTSTVLLFVVIIVFLKSKADEKRTVRDKIQERRLQLRHYLSIVFSIHRFLSERLSIIQTQTLQAIHKIYTPHFSGKVCLNFPQAWLLPVAVVRLHIGDLHSVGWGEGP